MRGVIGDGFFAKEIVEYCFGHGLGDAVLGCDPDLEEITEIILGSGKTSIKKKMLDEVGDDRSFFSVIVGRVYGEVGVGSVIAPGAVVAPFAKIGKHVLVNYGATVGHDTVIGDLSVVSPNSAVGGNCKIGRAVYIGAGSSIIENVSIGNDSIIGMGATVLKDVPPCCIVVGNPGMVFSLSEWDKVKIKLSNKMAENVDMLRFYDD